MPGALRLKAHVQMEPVCREPEGTQAGTWAGRGYPSEAWLPPSEPS